VVSFLLQCHWKSDYLYYFFFYHLISFWFKQHPKPPQQLLKQQSLCREFVLCNAFLFDGFSQLFSKGAKIVEFVLLICSGKWSSIAPFLIHKGD
jgi:hypothetical protein